MCLRTLAYVCMPLCAFASALLFLLLHIGVLWFDKDWLKDRGFKKDLQCRNQLERDKLAELADSIMSCQIPDEDKDDDENNMLRDYVLEV